MVRNFERVSLRRFCISEMGTFGELKLPNGKKFFTVEKPWEDNKKNKSCIPDGLYLLEKRVYDKGGYVCFELLDVKDRSHILIHRGNTKNDVSGCIAVGKHLGYVDGLWAVTNSRAAFEEIMEELENYENLYIDVM